MTKERARIELFLSPAGDRGQTLARGLGEAALAAAAEDASSGEDEADARPDSYLDPGGDPGSLRDQGWGVIAPRGEDGDRLLALARPLLEQRAAEQDGEVAVYRVPPDVSAMQAAAWIDRKLVGNELQEAIPGYLAVLGRPDQVSFELQQVLTGAFSVGRIGFDAEAGYEAYVDKLVRGAAARPSRAVYFTARDGTSATEIGHRLLMRPCIADAEQQRAAGRFGTSENAIEILALEEEAPARAADRLIDAAASAGVLFSCSHGAGAPRGGWDSPDRRRALQGAPCLGGGQHLEAELLARSPFVPGGVWLMFACFGAGTPRLSAYHHWLARLQQAGEHEEDLSSVLISLPDEGEPPFLAAQAQAALANPAGPVAIIGHIDLAWSYGFHDLEKMSHGERHRRFHEIVAQLVKGTRVGLALGGSLMRTRTQILAELAIAADAEARAGQELLDQRVRLGHRRLALQDLDGYIALGDPAARLAATRPEARARGEASVPAVAPNLYVEPSAALDGDAIQTAVHDLIADRATVDELAVRHGVAAATVEAWRRVYTDAGLRAVSALAARGPGDRTE